MDDCWDRRSRFCIEMVFAVRDLMQDAYPELNETAERVVEGGAAEETRFAHTLEVGLEKLEALLKQSSRKVPAPATEAFKLYDTFGMPLDFMQDAARDQGIEFDQAGFDRAMDEQQARARASWKGAAKQTANPAYQQLPKSEFEGYRQTRSEDCEVLAIIQNGQGVQELKPASRARSFSIIRRSMPSLADRLAIADGFTPTITTLSSPK